MPAQASRVEANGIELAYETFGSTADEVVLLISGLGTQMTRWTAEFCELLARHGHRVIRFDNRDAGLSTHFTQRGVPDFAALAADVQSGRTPDVAYTLQDMAADAIGLLDALGLERAHVVGRSMGGMIAQIIAATHPDRTLSLATIMSSTGNPALPAAAPDVMAMLTAPSPDPAEDEAAFVENGLALARRIGSPAYPAEDAAIRAQLLQDARRAYVPGGVGRQIGAIAATGDLRGLISGIRAPTQAIHGSADPLIPPAASEDIARNIAGARLLIIDGMGHDLPSELYTTVADTIAANARRGS
ncbi:MAG: alpha/beta hydrolase [Pseudomonadales bacterium]|jgi:pimeloyl-ACP methyl ester carboxylesterase